jgi:transposase-like protein
MQPNVEVSELCRREGINPTQYYGWKKPLLSSATKIFDGRESKRDASEEKKESELRRMKDVVAEITAENLELKKGLPTPLPSPPATPHRAALDAPAPPATTAPTLLP